MSATRKRERARAKTKDLKNRKIKTDLVIRCKLREEGTNGVLVRHDIGDESADVDMNQQTPQSCLSTPLDCPLDQIGDPMDVDTASAVAIEDATQYMKLLNQPRTRQHAVPSRDNVNLSRIRQPTRTQSVTALTEVKNEPSPASVLPMSIQSLGERCRDVADINEVVRKPMTEPLSVSEVNAPTDKNRSETYKQAWSISEQHLLERLLEEIPDGERNRYVSA